MKRGTLGQMIAAAVGKSQRRWQPSWCEGGLSQGALLLIACITVYAGALARGQYHPSSVPTSILPDGLPTADHSASAVAITRSPW